MNITQRTFHPRLAPGLRTPTSRFLPSQNISSQDEKSRCPANVSDSALKSAVFLKVVFLASVFWAAGLSAREIPFAPSIVDSDILGVQGLDAGDVEGDGDLDILVAARGNTGKIFWAENTNGDGSAWTLHEVDANFALAFSVAGGDLDHDGDLDIVGAANQDNDIAWWENTLGDGSTWVRHDIETSYLLAEDVAVGDVDNDGHLDVLAAASFENEVTWFENTNGTGLSWTEHTVNDDFKGARAVHGEDLDGDGDLDIMAAGELGDIVAWWENTAGDGSAWTQVTLEEEFDGGSSVHSADLDGDGDFDIVAAAKFDQEITWYENDGSWTIHVVTNSFDGASSVFAADLDDDGDFDLLGAAENLNDITWWENTAGDGSVWTEHAIASSFSTPRFTAAADFDKDGDLDVFASSVNFREVSWWENETVHRSATHPSEGQADEQVIASDFDGARAVAVGDFDGDADRDVAAVAQASGEVAWWENTLGDGSTFTKHLLPETIDGPLSIESLDLDRDGDQDLLTAAAVDEEVAWWQNDGSGSFVKNNIANVLAVQQASAADINGDSFPDVLTASPQETEVAWLANDGSGGTWAKTSIDAAYLDAQSVTGADLDGDGDLDVIALAAAPTNTVTWWENLTGSGLSWSAAQTIAPTFTAGAFVSTADMDCDGDLDVLGAGGGSPGILTWWENTAGDGSAWSEHDISCPACPEALDTPLFVLATDLDDDGDPDVLGSGSSDGGRLQWYENTQGNGLSWTLHTVNNAFLGAAGAAVADLDQDGDVDLLATAQEADRLSLWENRGGQFSLPTLDLGADLGDSVTEAVFRITAKHRGRGGDPDIELVSLEFLFEETAGVLLTTEQANGLIENLSIYRDDGDQTFDSGTDTLVALLGILELKAGVQTVAFFDGDPQVQASQGAPVDFFVVLETTATFTTGPINSLLLTHLTEASSTAEDADHDIPLQLEFLANVATGPIVANPEENVADLAMDAFVVPTHFVAGSPITYYLLARNEGPLDAIGATVTNNFPAAVTGVTWTCGDDPSGTGGGTCDNASGSGDLVGEIVNLPAGAVVRFTVTGTATGTTNFTNTASVTAPIGLIDPIENNSGNAPSIAVEELTFFADFEEGDFSEWDTVVTN